MTIVRLVKGNEEVLVDPETQAELAAQLAADGWKESAAAGPSKRVARGKAESSEE